MLGRRASRKSLICSYALSKGHQLRAQGNVQTGGNKAPFIFILGFRYQVEGIGECSTRDPLSPPWSSYPPHNDHEDGESAR